MGLIVWGDGAYRWAYNCEALRHAVREADGIIKQKDAQSFATFDALKHPGESCKREIVRKVPCRDLLAP